MTGDSDHSRIRHKKVAKADGEGVPRENIVKGYEIDKKRYVVFTSAELQDIVNGITGVVVLMEALRASVDATQEIRAVPPRASPGLATPDRELRVRR